MRPKYALMLLISVALPAQQVYFPPPDSEGGWRTLKERQAIRRTTGIDVAKLDEAFDFAQRSTKHGGLLVARKGWLVYERYFGRAHREANPNTASCGKSFTGIAAGMLLADRPDLFPDGLDQRAFTPRLFPAEAFPLADPAMAGIKLGQLLAMTAGIRGNNPGYVRGEEARLEPAGPDGAMAMSDEVALGRRDVGGLHTRTLWCKPGEGYSYATSSIHLVSIMIRHVTGMELEAFVTERLARPMGWGRFGWGYRNAGLGHTPGGGGIAPRSTDMLRFAYLLFQQGRWRDRQLVPASYVKHCGTASPYNPHYPYSLQFDVNADGHVAGVPRDAFWKTGSGGHALYVVPSLDLVIWKIGGRDEQYAPANTGLSLAPGFTYDGSREQWQREVTEAQAAPRTLQLIVQSVLDP